MNTTHKQEAFEKLQLQISEEYSEINRHLSFIKKIIKDIGKKKIKGNQIEGSLGEVYAKILIGGNLVEENFDYDLLTTDGRRIEVKTRRGRNNGWNTSGIIPRIDFDANEGPTHLLFINLTNNMTINQIWLYPWEYLKVNLRFKEKIVRKQKRGWYIQINEKNDTKFNYIFK